MWKRVEPSAGYALFFPTGKEKVIIGKPAICFFWQEFKQIELGSFKIDISDNSFANFELKTADNLPCVVKAIFRIEVNQDTEALEKATGTCSTTKNIDTKINHDFFIKQIQNTLEDIVKTQVEQINSSELLTDSQCNQNLQNKIREETEKKVSDIGFKLLGCSTDVKLAEPNTEYLARNSDLLKIWNEYLDKTDEIEQDLLQRERSKEEQKKKDENASLLVIDEEDAKYSVEKQKLIDERDKKIRELQLADEENKYSTNTKNAEIESNQQKLDDKILKEKLQYEIEREKQEKSLKLDLEKFEQEERYKISKEKLEYEIEREKQEKSFKLDLEKFEQEERYKQKKTELEQQSELQKLKHTEEQQEQQHKINSIQNELKLDEFKAQQSDLRKKVTEAETIQVKALGEAEAEVERLKVLANNAHIIEMNKALLTLLPDILEKAYGASEKLGEVKIMYLGGGVGNSNSESQLPMGQPLGSILSSMSTLPMLREVLHFINGWDLTKINHSANSPESSSQETNHSE